jgi:hypothetical protein
MTEPKQPKAPRRAGNTTGQTRSSKAGTQAGPDIAVGEGDAGRDTLAEISDEIRRQPWPRAPLLTVSYNDVPLDAKRRREAPVPVPPPPPARRPAASSPVIEVREGSLGRDSLALIGEEDGVSSEELPVSEGTLRCDVLELRTFVVPEAVLSARAGDAEKRAFLRDRLAHRLPCSVQHVRRIDARVLEKGAIMIRVWCPVE